jgi:hypothetical protein
MLQNQDSGFQEATWGLEEVRVPEYGGTGRNELARSKK